MILGRVSNLPTVWSNCLAGWWLGGDHHSDRLPFVLIGATFLYIAGMFLNDAFDVNFDRLRPPAFLDLTRLPELQRWERDGGDVFLGAGVSYTRIIRELGRLTPLVQASRTVGSPQIRNRGTVGGNLGTASPAGDALPVLAAYDAGVVVASAERGERSVPWNEVALAGVGTLVAAVVALAFVLQMLRVFRRRGYVTRFS